MDIVIAGQRYIRKSGRLSDLGQLAREMGLARPGQAILISGGETALSVAAGKLQASLAAALGEETSIRQYVYGKDCTEKTISALAGELARAGAGLLVAAGGGKALDTAKAAAFRARIPLVTVPTIAATCAAVTALSVIYSDTGQYLRMEYAVQTPSLVIVDTDIIAAAPRRYLRSGVGDTLAKWHEVNATAQKALLDPEIGGTAASFAVQSARAAAYQCYQALLVHAPAVLGDRSSPSAASPGETPETVSTKAASTKTVVPETSLLEAVVDAVILLAGLASGLGGKACRTACAHAVHDALTSLPEASRLLHGELVAFGVLCQAAVEHKPARELQELMGFYRRLALPVSLADLGLATDDPRLINVASQAAASPDMQNMPFAVSAVDLLDAFRLLPSLAGSSTGQTGASTGQIGASTGPTGSPAGPTGSSADQTGARGAYPVPASALARPEIFDARPFVPGVYDREPAALRKELGLPEVIKLSFNENTLGPSPATLNAMRRALEDSAYYNDSAGRELRQALARENGLRPENILLSNGADEMIGIICQTFLRPGEEAVVSDPTFGSYASSAAIMGGRVKKAPLKDFRHDLDGLLAACSPRTKLLFLCNPNNPTGTYVNQGELLDFVKRLPAHVLLVLDEAYREYVTAGDFPATGDFLHKYSARIILIRTFSKIHGLASLRVGYGLAGEDLIAWMEKVRLPFNVNRIAQAGALASLNDPEHRRRVKSAVTAEKEYLYGAFRRLGLEFQESQANFILVKIGRDADAACSQLLSAGLVLRSGSAFGLPDHLRVSVGSHPENERFVAELSRVLVE
ncbi:MAG: histidinol-phosphate transaminase [Firmicutes bacterium]|nr:histidinol-phosphate transaminase [Bacillota bacterium]